MMKTVSRVYQIEPSRGPEEVRVSSSTVNSSRINVTWLGLPREVAYGKIIRYEVRLAVLENCKESQSAYHLTINTTTTYFHVTGLSLFAKYEVSVRGYTAAGPGPYSRPAMVQTLEKPVIKDLPKRTISAIGELVVLNCEVFGHPEASVIWTKDGLNSIPRAQLKDNGKVLVINNVAPADSGVYECKAMNMFGESYTTTTLIVAGPPSLLKELSPPSVLCEKQTLCSLSCHATSYTPFNYSWTKDGHVPVGDNIKLMNNSIIVTPLDAQDYGEYVCHVANGYGSTKYKITLFASKDNQDGGGKYFAHKSNAIQISLALSSLIWFF
ncbi:hemicentin-2-like [Stylophora pistillata]|uniref:hemicentin-2-like n=1 Tax=Stylophora pistillata TaxID=50429 RepID=UPI000C03B315|nr:hemicentin-2-like [Stylophora pistillata]